MLCDWINLFQNKLNQETVWPRSWKCLKTNKLTIKMYGEMLKQDFYFILPLYTLAKNNNKKKTNFKKYWGKHFVRLRVWVKLTSYVSMKQSLTFLRLKRQNKKMKIKHCYWCVLKMCYYLHTQLILPKLSLQIGTFLLRQLQCLEKLLMLSALFS